MNIYQVLPRLFGNTNTTKKQNGSLDENGVGKFNDFTIKALSEIKKMGFSHIWYTGIIEHATQTDYANCKIKRDHSKIVKGKAGSPYAIKDYYDVTPDLAVDVSNRMKEFEAMIERTHKTGLKAIIDFVPNHVAREYKSDAKPRNVKDLGVNDIKEYSFHPDNNFYYIPDQLFSPQFDIDDYKEFPAKATGNDQFTASPSINDWYETIKLNYGIDYQAGQIPHFFPIPDTWNKMKEILLFWAKKKVDGFRCDMVEMVPVDFWGWVIPQIKEKHPEVIFIAEVYNPDQYRNYIHIGKFDYLYDKVGLYDTLRSIVCDEGKWAVDITQCWQSVNDIQSYMLNFLENHDEQRIASDFFAKDARKGLPAFIVSALLSSSPFMVYFGQELGEQGMEEEGFSGKDGRTTIFDYWSVDSIQKWVNGKYKEELLSEDEKSLRSIYKKVLNIRLKNKAFYAGQTYDLMWLNQDNPNFDSSKQFAFIRNAEKSVYLIVVNFDNKEITVELNLTDHVFDFLGVQPKNDARFIDVLTDEEYNKPFTSEKKFKVKVAANFGVILKLN